MTEPVAPAPVARTRVIRELRELIAALDRRVPQVHHLGEVAIATAAAELRDHAVKRLRELEDAEATESR